MSLHRFYQSAIKTIITFNKMNIFRFIADMLHLAAILLLLYRIKNTRNVVGKFVWLTYRYLLQDLRDLLDCILRSLPRFVYVLRQRIQHMHENFLYRFNSLDNIPYALQKAVLHDLWFIRWFMPSLDYFNSCRHSIDFIGSKWLDTMGICLVFFTLAWSISIYTSDYYVEQNPYSWEHH